MQGSAVAAWPPRGVCVHLQRQVQELAAWSHGPRAVSAPGRLPSPVQEASLESAPGPGPGGAQGALDAAESVFFPLWTDAALAHGQGCKQHTDAQASPPASRPLHSLGSDSSHPPGTSLILTTPHLAPSPDS